MLCPAMRPVRWFCSFPGERALPLGSVELGIFCERLTVVAARLLRARLALAGSGLLEHDVVSLAGAEHLELVGSMLE
jgi:hypothetical protein